MRELETPSSITVHPAAGSVLAFGPFEFDRSNQILLRDGEEVKLPPRALALLDLLVERRGAVVSKRTLLATVWKQAYVTETSLTEAVSVLRQALGDDPQRPTYIVTAHRRGYRFVAPVTLAGARRQTLLQPAMAEQSPLVQTDLSAGSDRLQGVPGVPRGVPAVAAGVVAAAVVSALVALWFARSPVDPLPRSLRASVETLDGVSLTPSVPSIALDPTGKLLAYVGRTDQETTRLYVRRLDSYETMPIPGTEGARSPFFSPDGAQLGFVANGQLAKLALEGGGVARLCDVPSVLGATWAADGSIVFAQAGSGGLSLVPSSGGRIRRLTHPDAAAGEVGHWWPQALPGGGAILYTIWSTTLATAKVAVLSLETGESRVLLKGASGGRFAPPGHLVFATPGGVQAAAFDLAHLQITGPPLEISDQAAVHPMVGLLHLEVAADGTVAYVPHLAAPTARELVVIDGAGAKRILKTGSFLFRNMDVDPTGRQLAVTVLEGARSDVWTSSLPDASLSRFTFTGFNIEPRWTPDGAYLAFASNAGGPFNIYRRPVGGVEPAELLVASDLHQYPQAWSADGRTLVYVEAHPATGYDLWLLDVDEPDRPRRPLLRTPYDEIDASLSPDGRWVAYGSNQTGAWEVYVRSFPDGNGPWQASERGGGEPFWSRDGATLYYSDSQHIIAITVDSSDGLRLGSRRTLMDRQDLEKVCVLPPDRGFIAIREMEPDPRLTEIRVVLGWSAEMARASLRR